MKNIQLKTHKFLRGIKRRVLNAINSIKKFQCNKQGLREWKKLREQRQNKTIKIKGKKEMQLPACHVQTRTHHLYQP